MYVAKVFVSMHEELPEGAKVFGTHLEEYPRSTMLKWLRVKLKNGVNRDVLVTKVRKIDGNKLRKDKNV